MGKRINYRSSFKNKDFDRLFRKTQNSITILDDYIALIEECYKYLVIHYRRKYRGSVIALGKAWKAEYLDLCWTRLRLRAQYLQTCNNAMKAMCSEVTPNSFIHKKLEPIIKACNRRDEDFQHALMYSDPANFLKSDRAIKSSKNTRTKIK